MKTIAIILGLTTAALAQQPSIATSGGLRFGMTVTQAKAVLTGQIASEERPPKNPTAYRLVLKPVVLEPIIAKGVPNVIFEHDHLIRVLLDYSVPTAEERQSAEKNGSRISNCGETDRLSPTEQSRRSRYSLMMVNFDGIAKAMNTLFQEKYGRPINETGTWPDREEVSAHYIALDFVAEHPDAPASFIAAELPSLHKEYSYQRAWRSGGQMIRISLSIVCDMLYLDIQYEPDSANANNY